MEEKRFSYGRYLLLLAFIIVVGRISRLISGYVGADISYALWVADVLYYFSEVMVAARNVLGYGVITWGVFRLGRGAGGRLLLLSFGGVAFEFALRFFLDFITTSIRGEELFYLISVLTQLVWEGLFLLGAWLLAVLFHRWAEAGKGRFFSFENGVRVMLLMRLAEQLLSETMYWLDQFAKFVGIPATEVIGGYLLVVVLFAGVPLLLAEGAFWLLPRLTKVRNGTK